MDSARKGSTFYDRGTARRYIMVAIRPLIVVAGDVVVEELHRDGVVIEVLRGGKCVPSSPPQTPTRSLSAMLSPQ